PDGLVDYREAYRRMYFADLTRENNAIFDYAQVLDPARVWSDRHRAGFMQAMGLKKSEAKTFIELEDFAELHPDLLDATLEAQGLPLVVTDEEGWEEENTRERNEELLFDWLFELQERPWQRADNPLAAAWLEDQADLLEHIERGSRKPGFFIPQVTVEGKPLDFTTYCLYQDRFARPPVRLLGCRAMLKAGEGHLLGAWNDYVTAYRLAYQFGRYRDGVTWIVGQAMRGMTMNNSAYFVHHAPLSSMQLAVIRKDFEALSTFPGREGVLEHGDRYAFLDWMQERPTDTDLVLLGKVEISPRGIDFNTLMRCYNVEIDYLVKVQQGPTIRDQVNSIERRLVRLREQRDQYETWQGRAVCYVSRVARSERAAYYLVGLLADPAVVYLEIEARHDLFHEFSRLAIILAQYRAAHGEYPATLDDLAPEFLAELPADPFATDGRIGYQRCDDGGYHLFSPGYNGMDDGGSATDYHEDYSEIDDDIVLRVPVQEPPGL
ncbi:MAG: hypothetical protein WEA31_05845, partial [Pirellulales bacterium]